MKKICVLVLAVLLCLNISGCKKKDKDIIVEKTIKPIEVSQLAEYLKGEDEYVTKNNITGNFSVLSRNSEDNKDELLVDFVGENDSVRYVATYLVSSVVVNGSWVIDKFVIKQFSTETKTTQPYFIEPVSENKLTAYLYGYDNIVKDEGLEGTYTIKQRESTKTSDVMIVEYVGQNDKMTYKATYKVSSYLRDNKWVIDDFKIENSAIENKGEEENKDEQPEEVVVDPLIEKIKSENSYDEVRVLSTSESEGNTIYKVIGLEEWRYVKDAYFATFTFDKDGNIIDKVVETEETYSNVIGVYYSEKEGFGSNSDKPIYLELQEQWSYKLVFPKEDGSEFVVAEGSYSIDNNIITIKSLNEKLDLSDKWSIVTFEVSSDKETISFNNSGNSVSYETLVSGDTFKKGLDKKEY